MVVDRSVKEFWGVSEEAFLANLSGVVGGGNGGTHRAAPALSRTHQLASVWSICHHSGHDIPVLDSGLSERLRMRLSEWGVVDDMFADTVLLLCVLYLQGSSRKEGVGVVRGNSGGFGNIAGISCHPWTSARNDWQVVRADLVAVPVDVPVRESGGREERRDDSVPKEMVVGVRGGAPCEEVHHPLGYRCLVCYIRHAPALPRYDWLCLQFPEVEHQDRHLIWSVYLPHDGRECLDCTGVYA